MVAPRSDRSGGDRPGRRGQTGGPDRTRQAGLEAANRTLTSQNELLKQLVTVYDRMTGMVLQGADLGAVTHLLSELIDRPVRVFDPMLEPLASASPQSAPQTGSEQAVGWLPWKPGEPQLAQMLENLAGGRRPVRIPPMPGLEVESGLVIAPIVAGDDILGYLTILEAADSADSSLDLLVVQHAATVYALTLTRQRLSADVTNRLREDLLEGLLLGQPSDASETEHRASLLGYDRRKTYRVATVRPEGGALGSAHNADAPAGLALRRRVLETIVEQVGRIARDAIAVARKDEVVILVPDQGSEERGGGSEPAAELGAQIVQRMQHPFPGVSLTVGISGPCRDLSQLGAAYAQARRTLAAARQFGRDGRVTTFEELGIYRLLFQVPSASELSSFAEQVLGALISYDRRHEADLVRTLSAYLRHHGSLQSAARELVVHVNTVSYRLQRVREIAGLDLDDSEDRLTAQVALKIVEGLEPN